MLSLKIGGICLKLSFPILAVTTLAVLLDREHRIDVCLLAALVHEAGHITLMLWFKTPPDKIILKLFAAEICDPFKGKRPFWQELAVIYGGISANFIFSAAAFALGRLFDTAPLLNFSAAGFVLGVFNSLPAATLDGGQGLYLMLRRVTSDAAAQRVQMLLTVMVLIPAAAGGFLLLFKSKGNFSLLAVSVYLIICITVKKEKF